MRRSNFIVGVTIGVVTLIFASMLISCGRAATTTLKVDGSTTVFPVAQACAEEYMLEHNETNILVTGSGSGTGISALIAGTTDICMSSRDLKSTELAKKPTMQTTIIALDAVAIIINKQNAVTQLTIDQVKAIYNGSFTNWNQIGGANLVIVAIGRETTSGTYEVVHEKIMNKTSFASSVLEKNSNNAVMQDVSNTPGAMGYVGLGYASNSTVKSIKLMNATTSEYITPNVENVLNFKYPIWRNLYLITDGAPTGEKKSFIDFVLSPIGQAIVLEEGFVNIAPAEGESSNLLDTIDGFNVYALVIIGAAASLLLIRKKIVH